MQPGKQQQARPRQAHLGRCRPQWRTQLLKLREEYIVQLQSLCNRQARVHAAAAVTPYIHLLGGGWSTLWQETRIARIEAPAWLANLAPPLPPPPTPPPTCRLSTSASMRRSSSIIPGSW